MVQCRSMHGCCRPNKFSCFFSIMRNMHSQVNPKQRQLHLAECGRHHHFVGCELQERQSNCFSRRASEETTPPRVPSSLDTLSQDPRFKMGLLKLDSSGMLSPISPDHHPHATVPALKLGISPLLVFVCFSQSDAVCLVRSCGESHSRAKRTPTWRRKPLVAPEKRQAPPPQLRAFCHPWRRVRRRN